MRSTYITLLILLSGCLQAQDIQFSVAANPNILQAGEQFSLTYTSNQELSELDIPDMKDFQLLGGPSQGHSQSFSSINGKITSTSTWQYTYFLLAVKEGKFTIPAATAKIKNKTYQSNILTVEVIRPKESTASQNRGSESGSSTDAAAINDKSLFVSLILDKKEAYLGEQITATVKIYTTVNLSDFDRDFKGPDFTGFFTEPVEVPPLPYLQREVVNGTIYYSGVIRKWIITPQKQGELTIQPFNLDVAVQQQVSRKSSDSFFDDFFSPDVREIPVNIISKAVKVNVKPLPANAPASYKGAVGDFTMNASLNKTSTETNDPLTLKISLTGQGNLKLISEPVLNIPADMEVFDPVIKTNADQTSSGTKTFEYLIMPQVAGKYTIAPTEFTYFNPSRKQYITLKTRSFDVVVKQGKNDTLQAISGGVEREDVRILNQDIRFIKTKPVKLLKRSKYLANRPVYYLLYAGMLMIFFLILFVHRRFLREKADTRISRLRKAGKYARKRLKKSAALLKQGQTVAFYEELSGALWGYLSDKLSLPVASLSKDSAFSTLQSRQAPQELTDQLFRVIDACEMARFARTQESIPDEKLYREALDVITNLQQKLK